MEENNFKDSQLAKFFLTPMGPKTTGVFALIFAVSLTLLFVNVFLQPTPTNQVAVIQSAKTVRQAVIVAGGGPVKFSVLINKSDVTKQNYLVKLPRQSSKIKITSVTNNEAENIIKTPSQEQLTLAQRNHIAAANQPKSLLASMFGGFSRFFMAAMRGSLDASLKNAIEKATEILFYPQEIKRTNNAIIVDLSKKTLSDVIKIDYEIPAPTIIEQKTSTGKIITVSDGNIDKSFLSAQMTDVLAGTKIPEYYKIGQESKIKINWKNESDKKVAFNTYDTDNNGKLDYVEWTVPHLSTQTFEVILVSKAFKLDRNRDIVEDVYDKVVAVEGKYVELTNGQYIEATFAKELDNTKDITIEAEPTNFNEPARVEAYDKKSGKLIGVFENIKNHSRYRILLTKLEGKSDIFYLKAIGNVKIEYIVDPGAAYYWVGGNGDWSNYGGHWATTSGGTMEYHNQPPTGSNDVFIDGNSSNPTITLDSSANALSVELNSPGGASLIGANPLSINGSLTVGNNCSISAASVSLVGTGNLYAELSSITYLTIAGTYTNSNSLTPIIDSLTVNGTLYGAMYLPAHTYGSGTISNARVTGSGSDIGSGANINISQMTFDEAASIINNGSATVASITAGTSGNWTQSSSSVFTYTGTSHPFSGMGGAFQLSASASGNTVKFTNSVNVTYGNYSNLYLQDTSNNSDTVFTFDSGQTYSVAGTLTIAGNDDNDRVNLVSNSPGSQWNLVSSSGSFTISWGDVKDSNASGGSAPTHTNTFNSGNNSNWNFFAPTQKSHTPVTGSAIVNASQTVDFITDENATCRVSTSDKSYPDMANDVSCANPGTTTPACNPGFSVGINNIYIACSDGEFMDTDLTNTHLTYTLGLPPFQSGHSPATGSTISDATPEITFTTDEGAYCRASTSDESYATMSDNDDCTGDGGTSQSCILSDLGADGLKSVHIACTDGNNADDGATNKDLAYTIDTTPPVPSSISPASGSTISDTTPTITFTTNENAYCRASTTDETYANMSDNDDCTGDGTTSQSCTLSDLGADGSKSVYIACSDGTNADTVDTNENLTYTLSTNAAPNAPTIVSPANATSTNDTTPTLSANYSDSDTGDTGVTGYRISSSSLTDCVNSTNIIASGTSSATSDNNEDTTWANGSSIGSDGTYYWCAQNNDGITTSSWTAMGSFTLDTASPATTASAGSYTFGNLSIPDVTVTLSCSDGSGSGCLTTYYCVSAQDTCLPNNVYATPVTFSSTGYIRYYSTDSVSNSETIASQSVKISSNSGGSTYDVSTPTQSTTETPSSPTTPTIVENIINVPQQVAQQVEQIINIFTPPAKPQQISYPPITESVPQEAPVALQQQNIIEINPLSGFLLDPISSDVSFFTDRIPKFKDTLIALGVNVENFSNVQKLSGVQMYLPGLTQTVLSPSEILAINKFAAVKGVPLAQLTVEAQKKIPTDIVFVRDGSELVDYRTSVLVDQLGQIQQTINTVVGRQIQLVIKPDKPAKSIIGFLTLKRIATSQTKNNVLGFVSKVSTASLADSVGKNSSSSDENSLLIKKFVYVQAIDGVYKATLTAPETEGEYNISTVIEYKDEKLTPKETNMTALVDPQGYVYSQMKEGKLRIEGAKVSLYWLNPDKNQYELWPADKFLQKNPIITNDTGRYSFLMPEGTYKIKVEAEGYLTFESDPFVMTESITLNKGLQLYKKVGQSGQFDWMKIIFSWQTVAILFLIVVLIIIMFFVKGRKITTN